MEQTGTSSSSFIDLEPKPSWGKAKRRKFIAANQQEVLRFGKKNKGDYGWVRAKVKIEGFHQLRT